MLCVRAGAVAATVQLIQHGVRPFVLVRGDGWTDRWIDREMDGQKDRWIDRQTDRWMDR